MQHITVCLKVYLFLSKLPFESPLFCCNRPGLWMCLHNKELALKNYLFHIFCNQISDVISRKTLTKPKIWDAILNYSSSRDLSSPAAWSIHKIVFFKKKSFLFCFPPLKMDQIFQLIWQDLLHHKLCRLDSLMKCLTICIESSQASQFKMSSQNCDEQWWCLQWKIANSNSACNFSVKILVILNLVKKS